MDFFATAAKGTEPALRDELRELGLAGVQCDRGGVHFAGDWEAAWRACLHARVALRVFHPLARFEAPSPAALYDGVRAIDWSAHLDPDHSLAVTAWCRNSALRHTNFTAQKTKDAIVDQQRDRCSRRSSVDRRQPDVPIFVHLVRDRATVYLDLAGESLHRRGYRRRTVEAPLKENLAAALLRLGGWDRERPLCDPMCGSGTIAIEAWQWSRRIAPGLGRRRFAFERWPRHDAGARRRMEALRAEARAAVLREGPAVLACDRDGRAVAAARANARAAGAALQIEQRSVFDLEPLQPPGCIASNPPYGARLGSSRDFYDRLGTALRALAGHRVVLLAAQRRLQRALRLKPELARIVYNGDIQCRLLAYRIR